LIQSIASLLDLEHRADPLQPPFPASLDPEAQIQYILNTTGESLRHRDLAFSAMDASDREFLARNLEAFVADLIASSSEKREISAPAENVYKGRSGGSEAPKMNRDLRMMQLAHDIDFQALLKSAALLAALGHPPFLSALEASLAGLPPRPDFRVKGIGGPVLYFEETPLGRIAIGGEGANYYSLDAAVIIDLGGDDVYADAGGAKGSAAPVTVVIDLGGDDQYAATAFVSQGSGFMGTAILIDKSGDDTYTGAPLSQGAGVMGVGILVDYDGDDRYFGQELAQGIGFWGFGLLLDTGGADRYHSHLFAQGVGGPKGVGLLVDIKGPDAYLATGKHRGTYGSKGIFSGFSQGFGFGFRGYTSGGIGVLIDAEGQDKFRAGNFSQGGGYFFGLGILKNAGREDDVYLGSRYGQGFSAHSAMGILIDDGGNDRYSGQVGALQGAAWDKGAAALIDKSGDDLYDTELQFFSQGAAAHNGFSLFLDQSGTDRYRFQDGDKIGGNHYHGGISLSFFIDSGGGEDQYNGSLGKNGATSLSGEYGIMADLDYDLGKTGR
jgi:hypothetical protein